MLAPDDALFTEVFEGDGDVTDTDTEEACTLRCEAACIRLAGLDRADRGAVPNGGTVLDGDTPAKRHVAGTEADGAMGISPRPRQIARIGVPGEADCSARLDRADRPVVPVGGLLVASYSTATR